MSDKVYLGQNVSDLDYDEKSARISRVNLSVDSDHIYTAGDDTGRTLEVSCPWGSQAMADSILAKVSGIDYQPYEASDALLDQAAEIGDGITLGGVYSVIAQSSISLDKQCAANIYAPHNDEIDDEYPYKSQAERQIERKIATTRSMITKTAEEIRLEVSNELDGLSASLSVSLNQIRSEVSGKIDQTQAQTLINQGINGITLSASAGENQSTIYIKANGITIDSQVVTFSNIVADEVNADNIIGSLTSDQIDLYGDMTVWKDSRLRTAGGTLGYTFSTLDGTGGIHLLNNDGNCEVRVTTNGAAVESYGASFVAATNATISSSSTVRLLGDGGCYSNGDTITSDKRLKDKIDYERPLADTSIIDELKPCIFEYTQWQKGKKHYGFIAQDVVDLLKKYGYGETDIIVGKDPETDMYALAYTEFIPLIIAKLQQMGEKMKELEALVS